MKFAPSALLATTCLQALSIVQGARFSARGRPRRSEASVLSKRDDAVIDLQDMAYYVNITLSGEQYEVQIDTGSSDLWVAGTVTNANNTGTQATINYAVGSDTGPIMTADMTWDGYDFTVTDQAFIQVTPSDASPEGLGLVGLGPSSGSVIYQSLNQSAAGETPLNRIFLQNTSEPNFITVSLGRSNFSDPDAPTEYPGDFTIGEVIPEYANITSQPQLDVTHAADSENQHWSVLLDANGVTVGNGTTFQTTTTVSQASDKSRLTFVFDSGFTLPQVPADLAKAIYGDIPGAKLVNLSDAGESWVMSCAEEVNVTFVFGGVSIPIHPLDATMQDPSLGNDSQCLGTFQPISDGAAGDYDGILGMAFLRNAYLLVNFGDFVDGNTTAKAPGYTQLLAMTDPATAHAEFVKVRQSGQTLSSTSTLAAGDVSASSVGQKVKMTAKKIAMIVGIAVGVLLLVLLGCCCLCCKGRGGGRYRQLNDPAPMAAVDVHGHHAPATYVPYNDGQYQTAWDHRS